MRCNNRNTPHGLDDLGVFFAVALRHRVLL